MRDRFIGITLLSVLLSMLSACSDLRFKSYTQTLKKRFRDTVVNFPEGNVFPETGEIRRIVVADGRNVTRKLSELADSVYYIRLETTPLCLIGKIDKLVINDSLIVVIDKTLSKSVFLFDKNGRFLSKINQIGEGPEEYLSMNDCSVDFGRKLITILDISKRKLFMYGMDGQFSHTISIPLYFSFLEYFSDGGMLWASNDVLNSHLESLQNYSLFLTTEKGEILHALVPFQVHDLSERCTYVNHTLLTKAGSTLYYHNRYADTIREVSQTGYVGGFWLDFKGRSYTWNELQSLTDEIVKAKNNEPNFFYFNGEMAASDQFAYFRIFNKLGLFGCFCNRITGSSFSLDGIDVDHPDAVLFNWPYTSYKNYFVTPLQADMVTAASKVAQQLKKSGTIKKMYSEIKPDDNPILMFYHFK